MKNIEITGINITINGSSIILTIDEARELYNKLHQLFGKDVIFQPPAMMGGDHPIMGDLSRPPRHK